MLVLHEVLISVAENLPQLNFDLKTWGYWANTTNGTGVIGYGFTSDGKYAYWSGSTVYYQQDTRCAAWRLESNKVNSKYTTTDRVYPLSCKTQFFIKYA